MSKCKHKWVYLTREEVENNRILEQQIIYSYWIFYCENCLAICKKTINPIMTDDIHRTSGLFEFDETGD